MILYYQCYSANSMHDLFTNVSQEEILAFLKVASIVD